jgi:hypothetical protein
MKKILLLVSVVIILGLISSLLLIPNNIKITKVGLLQANKRTAYRCLSQEDLMQKYLKSSETKASAKNEFYFNYNDVGFQFRPRMFDLVEVAITNDVNKLNSFISLNALSPDSTLVEWRTEMKTSANPLKRIHQFLQAQRIHKSMSDILISLAEFVINKDSVYDLSIERTFVTDSLLVTTKTSMNEYPSEHYYYDMIKNLQDYISSQGATATNYPMLNITSIDSNKYDVTVAVPVNKVLPNKGSIFFKRMFPGNILMAEVKGGIWSVEEGFIKINNYVSDYQLVPPAISFQSLVTDRMAEKDSTKWITKLYYPIF